jgi:hypothetical protein
MMTICHVALILKAFSGWTFILVPFFLPARPQLESINMFIFNNLVFVWGNQVNL